MRLLPVVLLTMLGSGFGSAQTYTISTVAGGALPVNLPGTSANLAGSQIQGLAVDTAGDLYFPFQNSVFRLAAQTNLLTVVAGTGTAGFNGANGSAASSPLNNPSGVALDSAGNLYIADTLNNCVRKVNNGVITVVAGTGKAGFSGDNGAATSAELNQPFGVAVDASGDLFISDQMNNVIRKVTGGVITTVAGTGQPTYGGDNGLATSAQLNQPAGIAVDSAGNLYIADFWNQRVRKVSNGIITTVAGTGQPGYTGNNGVATSADLYFPIGVAVDTAGDLYIADSGNSMVREVTNGIITTAAGDGNPAFSGDGGPAVSAGLTAYAVTVDSTGNLYISDSGNNRVRKVAGGLINTVAGGSLQAGDGGAAALAQLADPQGVALDSSGNLYIADSLNRRVRKVSGGVINTVAGTGVEGYSGDNGLATSAQLVDPYGVAVDSAGNLYISDPQNYRIRKVSNGLITTFAGNGTAGYSGDNGLATSATLSSPTGIAVDASGNVYFADTNTGHIREVSNGIITTVAGNGIAGYGGDNGPATSAGLHYPYGIAADSAGNLYIADTFNQRIRKVSGGVITTVAGNGIPGYSGDSGLATSAQLNDPNAVAVDSAGNLYIADQGNNVIREVSNGVITTIAGGGSQFGDNGPATSAQFSNPSAVAVASNGNVYVSDSGNARVRLLSISSTSSGSGLSISKSHTGNFAQSQTGAIYTVTVSNSLSAAPTSGTVTVAENLPSGLTLASMSGTGWNCFGGTCSRNDQLNPGASYPAISVTVNVASNATSPQVNSVTLTAGSLSATATDSTVIGSVTGVTIQTSPTGLQFTVDGTAYTAPQTLSLTQGNHTLAVATPQTGAPGTQDVFAFWSDGGAASHTITVGSTTATYTATFTSQYLLSISVAPPGGGTISASPAGSGGYYTPGTSVLITASPSAGYQFSYWAGDLSGSANSQFLTMNGPHSVVAAFSSTAGACSFTLSPQVASLPATGTASVEICPNGSGQPNCGVIPESPRAFTVIPTAACGTWTATSSNPTFLQVATGATGSGTSSVTYALLTNTHTLPESYSITVASGGASSSFTVTEAGSGDNQTYREVYALYEQLLGRDPDTSGLAFWTGTGSAGLGQMADAFLTSPEAFNSDFVVMATYQAATGAAPTFAEFVTSVANVRAGMQTVTNLFNSLIGAGYSATTMYQNLLNRQPTGTEINEADSAGLANWFQTLIGYPGNVTPVSTPNNEFQSTGPYHTDHTNGLYIQMLYYVILGRNPDLSGFSFWLGIANTGGPGLLFQGAAGAPTRIQIVGPGTPNQGFIGSTEFQNLFLN